MLNDLYTVVIVPACKALPLSGGMMMQD